MILWFSSKRKKYFEGPGSEYFPDSPYTLENVTIKVRLLPVDSYKHREGIRAGYFNRKFCMIREGSLFLKD